MFRFLRKTQKRKDTSYIEAYEQGFIPCGKCGGNIPLEQLQPLTLAACPSCETSNFVPLQIKHYWLMEPLGGGGMGSVYKAYEREHPFRSVAVKIVPPGQEGNQEDIDALYHEAEIANQVKDHPSLAGVLEWGCVEGKHFAAMEYIEGDRMDNAVEHEGHLSIDRVLRLASELIDADEYLYNKGYLYRDLKPQNVILQQADQRAVLFDYGLCVTLEQAHNPQADICSGSPHFIPPERVRGMSEDACSEIYSLGMVMYYALTGNTFFRPDEAQKLANKHLSEARVPMSSKLRGYPSEVVQLMTKMTKHNPEERFQTFEETKNEIEGAKTSLSSQTAK